jgi:N utilization substance protein B
MAAKRHERTAARHLAVQVLYQSALLEKSATAIIDSGLYLDEIGIVTEYSSKLIAGVEKHKEAIDEYLISTSQNWTLARMPIVDRSILRLAVYEILYVEDVPCSVSINEAVELAKNFGGDEESPRFVNGILGRIAELLEENAHDKQ